MELGSKLISIASELLYPRIKIAEKLFSISRTRTQYENYGNLLSLFFDKIFVKVTFLLKKIES